ncbi:MAG: hypothetical protein R3195_08365 [Gemmatimonadota bacterium]|nr:hypothetical protein [Gemmatimonadota bacterium]
MATDGDRLALSGYYRGPRDIDEDGRPEPHDPDPERESEIAVLILAGDGAIEDAWTAVGPGNDQARAAVFLPERPIVYVTGFVQLTADFSGDGVNDEGWVRCDALGDVFVARYELSAR